MFERLRDNPFYVLGLPTTATRAEVEREGQKLLAMLELGLESVQTYATPAGAGIRTADKVREATAELRDPSRRLRHELWASAPAEAPAAHAEAMLTGEPAPRWPDALVVTGWRKP
jgi:hypothetical protein